MCVPIQIADCSVYKTEVGNQFITRYKNKISLSILSVVEPNQQLFIPYRSFYIITYNIFHFSVQNNLTLHNFNTALKCTSNSNGLKPLLVWQINYNLRTLETGEVLGSLGMNVVNLTVPYSCATQS